MVLARYVQVENCIGSSALTFELDVKPVLKDLDDRIGAVGHIDHFARMPLWRKILVRLLKAWLRLRVHAPGLLLEIVAAQVPDNCSWNSPDDRGRTLHGFLTALELLLKDCEWLDPVDCSNNVALQLSNTTWAALRQYIKVTLDIFVQRPMFVPRAALPSIMSQQTIIATSADHAMNDKSGERVLLNIYATTGDRASAAKSEISKLVAENTSLLKPF